MKTSVVVHYLVHHEDPVFHLERFIGALVTAPAFRQGSTNSGRLVMLVRAQQAEVGSFVFGECLHRLQTQAFDVSFLSLPGNNVDLGYYGEASRLSGSLDSDVLAFLNSYSRPLVPGWADLLVEGLMADPSVGLVGSTASWESTGSGHPFPNHHLRTNAFACLRGTAKALLADRPQPIGASTARSLEAGADNISRKLGWAKPRVVSALGSFPLGDARGANVFRSGDQRDLLVADNRTNEYQSATPEHRQFLETLSWGSPEGTA